MKQLLNVIVMTGMLVAAFIANYLLRANPPATSPLALVDAPAANRASSDDTAGTLLPREALFFHTQTRPLFSPTRRKWVEPAAVVQETEPQLMPVEPPPEPPVVETSPPDVKLIGIEKTPAGGKALLIHAGGADALWLKQGEELEGWAVVEIDSGSVEMALGERRIRFELYPLAPSPAAGIGP